MTAPIPVAWRPRAAPLSPVGVAAVGPAALALAARLLARSDAALARLSGVAGIAGGIGGAGGVGTGSIWLRGPVTGCAERPKEPARRSKLSQYGGEGRELLLVLASAGSDGAELPWVDGVTYLGRDPAAPLLYLPTTVEPTVHPRLFERALLALAESGIPPLAVLLSPLLLVSTAEARPIVRDRLAGWLAGAA